MIAFTIAWHSGLLATMSQLELTQSAYHEYDSAAMTLRVTLK